MLTLSGKLEKERNCKYKAVFVHPYLGNSPRIVIDIALALKQQNVDVQFLTNHICFNNSYFNELEANDIKVYIYGWWIPGSICGFFRTFLGYLKILYLCLMYILFLRKKDYPDVYFIDSLPVVVPLLKTKCKKLIYYCHDPETLKTPYGGVWLNLHRVPLDLFEEKCTGMSDIILVNSIYVSKAFRKYFPSVRKEIRVLYPTVTPPIIELLQHAQHHLILDRMAELEFVCQEANIVFVSINDYKPIKNLELAMEALHYLRYQVSEEMYSRVYLLLAGVCEDSSSENYNYLQKLTLDAFKFDVYTQVFFVKSPSERLKANLSYCADCLIYTSSKDHCSIIPLEAMAGGTPVIAVNEGGAKEVIQHNYTGFVCEADPVTMATYMCKIASNRKAAREMGRNGKFYFQKSFAYDEFKKRILSIVEGTMDNWREVIEV